MHRPTLQFFQECRKGIPCTQEADVPIEQIDGNHTKYAKQYVALVLCSVGGTKAEYKGHFNGIHDQHKAEEQEQSGGSGQPRFFCHMPKDTVQQKKPQQGNQVDEQDKYIFGTNLSLLLLRRGKREVLPGPSLIRLK